MPASEPPPSNPDPRPAALLDVDGTLVPDALGIAFTAAAFPDEDWYADGIAPAVARHAVDQDAYPYDVLVGDVFDYWAQGMTGRHKPTVEQRAAAFIADYAIPAAAHTVVDTLARAGFDIYFVSISPQEVLDPFADRLCDGQAAGVCGTVLSVTADNTYDGSITRNLHADTKAAILSDIFEQSARAGSIAVGDTTHDLPLFEAADTAIVTAPQDDLPDALRARTDCWDTRVTDVDGLATALADHIAAPDDQ